MKDAAHRVTGTASNFGLEKQGLHNLAAAHWNLSVPVLYEQAVRRGEGLVAAGGAFVARTGAFTGRTPKDKYIVEEASSKTDIWWGEINKPVSEAQFESMYRRVAGYFQGRELFVQDLYGGADPDYRLKVRIVSPSAWHSMFVRNMFIRPRTDALHDFEPDFTILHAPHFFAQHALDGTGSDTFIFVNFARRLVLIGGTEYAGEIKKSVFGYLNFLLPARDVLPMHCSANVGPRGDSAIFFGLSGTGKTTLSADGSRTLIGDDEHGWSHKGLFNFEGGCYAKAIRLRPEGEPLIWNAVRFGALLENVVVDPESRAEDWDSADLTENSRVAYPIDFVPDAVDSGMGGHPEVVFFLTADAYGVLPPISRLDRAQAEYHFLAGYTSKVAGTERGLKGTEATFSTLFGAPFFPLPATTYAAMLGERLDRHGSRVYLVNTGWCGDAADAGRKRINLAYTRAMVNAAIDGELDKGGLVKHPVFGVMVPRRCPGVPDKVLDPSTAWPDAGSYERAAKELAARFEENRLNPSASGAG